MADQAIIGELIATYRELNHRLRGVDFGPARPDTELVNDDKSVSGILFQMRNRELRASQSIKSVLAGGKALASDEEVEASGDVTGAPHTVEVLLSQFGTAREATLSQVRDLSDEAWAQSFDTPRGPMALKDYLQSLVDRDRQRLAQIEQLTPKQG